MQFSSYESDVSRILVQVETPYYGLRSFATLLCTLPPHATKLVHPFRSSVQCKRRKPAISCLRFYGSECRKLKMSYIKAVVTCRLPVLKIMIMLIIETHILYGCIEFLDFLPQSPRLLLHLVPLLLQLSDILHCLLKCCSITDLIRQIQKGENPVLQPFHVFIFIDNLIAAHVWESIHYSWFIF